MRDRVYVVSDGKTCMDRELCSILADKIIKDLHVYAARDTPVDYKDSLAVVLVGEGVEQIVQAQNAAKNNVPCIYFPTDADAGTLHHKYGTETFFVTNSAEGIISCIHKAQELYKKRVLEEHTEKGN